MIDLEDWLARASAPPLLAFLKEALAGTGPTLYRIAGGVYLDESEADHWLARSNLRLQTEQMPARASERAKSKPTFPPNGPRVSAEALGRLYVEALDIIRPGARN
jgi:hypothetical protein